MEKINERQQKQAQQHSSTWKLLATFSTSSDQPEVPPSQIYEHYRSISQDTTAPLEPEMQEQRWQGPPLREDSALVEDITPDEAGRALADMNMGSAPGPDGLYPAMVRSTFTRPTLLVMLAQLFTCCFQCAFTPSQWRKAENFILYKGRGVLLNVSSFRAISLTSIIAKVYERVLYWRLWAWFQVSRLFDLPQFGFRRKSSTIDAVFTILCLIRQHTVVLKVPLHVAFVDITKAFPSLNRQGLFERLVIF